MSYSIGVYCGTFNPLHIGHLNIAEKAKRIFDIVYIAQGQNPEKAQLVRKHALPPSLEGFQFKSYRGLTTDLLTGLEEEYTKLRHPLFPNEPTPPVAVTLIRGIRNGYDYDYEMSQIQVMRDLKPGLQTILIPCDREYAHISSSMIRNLEVFNPDLAKQYIVQ